MINSDLKIIGQIVIWLKQNKHVYLFTVVKTWGASPRPAGSLLAVNEDGNLIGSVSGGCVEDNLLQRVSTGEFKNTATLINYGVSADEANIYGLPCGGNLLLYAESNLHLTQFEQILDKIKKRQLVNRRVCLTTNQISVHPETHYDFSYDNQYINRIFGPQWKLLIIGAGELSYYVSKLALMLNFDTHICDPREKYINSWTNKQVTINKTMPDDTVISIKPDPTTAVIALTHDLKLDDMALMEALKSKAFYVGALGSTNTNKARRERLQTLGLKQNQVDQLHGPIGLGLGSKTPAEIAVSIISEIIAVRYNKTLINQ